MNQKKLDTIKTSGFTTPQNYFSQVEEQILNEVHLINKTDQSGFEVPNNYFDTLDENVLGQLEQNKPVFILNPRQSFYYIAGIAASLILLFAIFINKESKDDISAEMVEAYFEASDLDTYELLELLVHAELLEDDFVISETNYNEENIEAYLLEYSDIEELLQ
jgi:hypothetical protein